MRKIHIAILAAVLLIFSCPLSQAESVSGYNPNISHFTVDLDNDLNFNLAIEFSNVAGGVANSTIFAMIVSQPDDAHIAYDVFLLKEDNVVIQEVLKDGKGEGKLELSAPLSKYTYVESHDDIMEISIFLVDTLGKKSKTQSLKFNVGKRNKQKTYWLYI